MGRHNRARDSRWLAPRHESHGCPQQTINTKFPDSNATSYGSLVRRTLMFQFRLAADSLRDLLLSPISVIAALLGLLNPNNPSWAFDRLMNAGRISDRWINLFEQEDLLPAHDRGRTMDDLVDHIEREVKTRMDQQAAPENGTWADSLHAAFKGNQPEG